MLLLALFACGGPEPHPMDDVLRVEHVQAVGTHNSYHVMTAPRPELAYTHPPLDVQLDAGLRHFELDLWPTLGAARQHLLPVIHEAGGCSDEAVARAANGEGQP